MNLPLDIGQMIDGVIAATMLEFVVLVLYHRFTGRGIAPRNFVANMAAGLALMLALRGLANHQPAAWIALFLSCAGLAHFTDIVMRWLRASKAGNVMKRVAT